MVNIVCCEKLSLSAAVSLIQNRNTLFLVMLLWSSTALFTIHFNWIVNMQCVLLSPGSDLFFLNQCFPIRRAICGAHRRAEIVLCLSAAGCHLCQSHIYITRHKHTGACVLMYAHRVTRILIKACGYVSV